MSTQTHSTCNVTNNHSHCCLKSKMECFCSQVERYDPLSNKWTMMAPLRDGVSNAAVVSAKLKLFVFGGTTIHRDKASKVSLFQ